MQLCLLPKEEFFKSVSVLGDMDLRLLEITTRSLVSTFLGLQSSQWLSKQRIMPNVAFRVWSPNETTLHTIESIADGSFQERASTSARCHLALLKLATELRAHSCRSADTSLARSHLSHLVSSSLHRQSSGMSLATSVVDDGNDGVFTDSISPEKFSQIMAAHTTLAESDIREVYDYITCTRSATPTLRSLMETLVVEAPHLNNEQETRLRALDLESFHPPRRSSIADELETVDENSSSCPKDLDVSRDVTSL